jgi:hypothetical protein
MEKVVYSLAFPQEEHECRCHCGNLLARLRLEGVELKCRRCKRMVLIPWEVVVGEGESEEVFTRERRRPCRMNKF